MFKAQRVAGVVLTSAAVVSLVGCGGSSSKSASTAKSVKSSASASPTSKAVTIADADLTKAMKAARGSTYSYNFVTNLGGLAVTKGTARVKDNKIVGFQEYTQVNGAVGTTILQIGDAVYFQMQNQWYAIDPSSSWGKKFAQTINAGAGTTPGVDTDQTPWTLMSSSAAGKTYQMKLSADDIRKEAAKAGKQLKSVSATTFVLSLDPQGRPIKRVSTAATYTAMTAWSNYGVAFNPSAPKNVKPYSSFLAVVNKKN